MRKVPSHYFHIPVVLTTKKEACKMLTLPFVILLSYLHTVPCCFIAVNSHGLVHYD